jgi:hypothetical protein
MIPKTPKPDPSQKRDQVGSGVMIAILCQIALIVAGMITFFVTNSLQSLIAGWGVVQWLVPLPLYLILKRRGRRLAAKGIFIVGSIGFLLNTGCYALFTAVSR